MGAFACPSFGPCNGAEDFVMLAEELEVSACRDL